MGSQTHEIPGGSQLGVLQPGGTGQVSNIGDQNLIPQRPTGGIPSQIGQQVGGDGGGYRYQTPQDRLPSDVGGQPTGKQTSLLVDFCHPICNDIVKF